MFRTFFVAFVGLAMMGMTSPSAAIVLDENSIQNNFSGNCLFNSPCTPTPSYGAENFSLSSDSTVEELVIFAGASVIPASLNVNWALYSDGGTVPGTLLYSGTDAAAFTDTGANFGCCNTLNIFSILIDIPDVALLAGDYWVAFLISSSTTPIYWADTTDGDSKVASGSSLTSYVAGYPPPPGTSHARGFQVLGSAAAVPLPAALPLFATGLGALGLLGWRRKRKHAALAA